MRILSYISIVLLVTLVSCNTLKITENVDKGVKEVLFIYSGVCKYSISWTVSTETGKQKKFELEMSQSPFIDQLPEQRDLFASGIAYAFYKNLQEEKHQYSHIKVVLLAADGGKQTYEYEVNELQTVKQRMGVAENIAKLIKAKKFQAIKPLLNDSSYFTYDKNELIENIIKAEPMFGNALEFIPVGYHISRIDGHNNLHIAGEIKRDKQTNNFSVDIDIDDKLKRATLINYKF